MAYVFVREPLSREEMDRLVNACWSFREKLVVWTLLDTGLRVSELCGLSREDIHWQEDRMVIRGKGGRYGTKHKRRIVPLTPRVKKLLEMHFISSNQLGITVRTAQRVVKRVAERATITKPVSPHCLRHSFAVACVQRGVTGCACCDELYCHPCLSDCTECGEFCCPSCLEDELCQTCRENQDMEEQGHEQESQDIQVA